jgi:DNA-binding transcriptional LysR family regulator
VSFGHPSGVTTWRLYGPNGAEEEVQITSRFNGNTAQALRKATLAGLGIALLPPTITKFDLQAGRLVPVLPNYHRTGYGLHVLYPSRQHLPLAVSAFIGLVMEKLKEDAFPASVLPQQA